MPGRLATNVQTETFVQNFKMLTFLFFLNSIRHTRSGILDVGATTKRPESQFFIMGNGDVFR